MDPALNSDEVAPASPYITAWNRREWKNAFSLLLFRMCNPLTTLLQVRWVCMTATWKHLWIKWLEMNHSGHQVFFSVGKRRKQSCTHSQSWIYSHYSQVKLTQFSYTFVISKFHTSPDLFGQCFGRKFWHTKTKLYHGFMEEIFAVVTLQRWNLQNQTLEGEDCVGTLSTAHPHSFTISRRADDT